MGVSVDLANIIVFGFASTLRARPETATHYVRPLRKRLGERSSHVIERLVLSEKA